MILNIHMEKTIYHLACRSFKIISPASNTIIDIIWKRGPESGHLDLQQLMKQATDTFEAFLGDTKLLEYILSSGILYSLHLHSVKGPH